MTQLRWQQSAPTHCDVCRKPLSKYFVDGRTRVGRWAIMCSLCHTAHGVGLGTGNGQKYDLTTLIKTEG